MDVIIGKVKATLFVHLAVLEILGTIFLCYGTAVVLGHVPAWLPMISDCAVSAPEKYPFRLGLVTGAILLEVVVVLVYNADKGFSNNKKCLVFGSVASFALGVVGSVNEQENNTVHSGCAVIFFIGYEVYMVLLCCSETHSICLNDKVLTASMARKLLAFITGSALIALAVMSMHWGKYKLYIAICEWTATMCILLFQWTVAIDLSNVSVGEIKLQKNGNLIKLPNGCVDVTVQCDQYTLKLNS